MTSRRSGLAITEPDSGSDAWAACARAPGATARSTSSTARRRGSPRPYADTIVLYAKLDDGSGRRSPQPQGADLRPGQGDARLEQVRPMRKMASTRRPPARSPQRRARGKDRLRARARSEGGGRQSAKDNFVAERAGVAAMSLGSSRSASGSRSTTPSTARSGKADRRLPAHPTEARQMEIARINVRTWSSPHRALRGRHGAHPGRGLGHEALRRPGRLPGGRRRDPDLRRQRLHRRVPRRAAPARCQGAAHLRRDRRDAVVAIAKDLLRA